MPETRTPRLAVPHPPGVLARAGILPFEVRTSRGRVRGLRGGTGPHLLLLHGLGGLAEEVAAPLAFLASRYEIVAVDRPGYGGSDAVRAADMAPDRQAEWLGALVRTLGLRRPVLVAHSLAAGPALWLALRRPDVVRGLVLLAPFCRPTPEGAMPLLRLASSPVLGAPLRAALPLVAPRIAASRLPGVFEGGDVPDYMRELPFAAMAQPSAVLAMAAELRGFNAAMQRLAGALPALRVRTVFLAGERDRVADWRWHSLWASRRIPDSAGATLQGVGHMLHHVRPAMVAAAIESARGAGSRTPLRRV